MNMLFRRTYLLTLLTSAALATPLAAFAQAAPLRLILPVGAGSGVDTIVRAAQTALAAKLNQPVVVENLPGAGGITGTTQLVKAAPDGKTIGFVSNNHSVNPSVFKKMPFDSLADITPISVVGETPFVLVVNPTKLPVKTAKEFQAALKAKPGHYNFASSGNGTILHLAAEMVVDATGTDAKHIPYKGVGPMLVDLISGQVDFAVASLPSVQGHLKSGALRPIGITGSARIASLPDLPTIKEQGFPEVEVAGWFAAVGPKGLPAAEVKRLNEAIAAAWASPDVKESMAKQENIIKPMTSEASTAFFKSEQERYARLVEKAGIKLD